LHVVVVVIRELDAVDKGLAQELEVVLVHVPGALEVEIVDEAVVLGIEVVLAEG